MADLTNLLQQYTTTGASAARMREVADAAVRQKTAITGTTPQDHMNAAVIRTYGEGQATATPIERDLNLPLSELMMKYGVDAALNMNSGNVAATNQLQSLKDSERSATRAVSDTATDVGIGYGSGIANVGALGLGTVSPTLGGMAAEGIDAAVKLSQGTQSDALNQKRQISAARNALADRDSDAQYQKEGPGLLSGLRKIGRETLKSVDIATDDPSTFVSGTAQGIGSLLSGGTLIKGAGLAANGTKTLMNNALGNAGRLAVTPTMAANAAGIAGKGALAMGTIEAGGSYQQTYNKAMEALASRTDLDEGQKERIANKTALDAAAWTTPTAIAAGGLVDKFAANPLAGVGTRAALQNMGKETIEEGLQGGLSQLAQNQALRTNVSPELSLTEGVGQQIGEGALYGLGTAGALAAPGITRGAVEKGIVGTKKALTPITNWSANRAKKVAANNMAASPLSATKVADTVAKANVDDPELIAQVEAALAPTETDTPEVAAKKVASLEAFNTFRQTMKVSPEELTLEYLAPIAQDIADTPDRVTAAVKVIKAINEEQDLGKKIDKVIAYRAFMSPLERAGDPLIGVDSDDMPDDVNNIYDSFGSISKALQESPEVVEMLKQTAGFFSTPGGEAMLNDMNQTVDTAVKVALAAQIAPKKINPEVANAVLAMAKDGTVQLTPEQIRAVTNARDMMTAARKYDEEILAAGGKPTDIVGAEVKTDTDDGRISADRMSALQHGQKVQGLFDRGDLKGAKAALEEFGNFAFGHSNKILAANESLAAGGGIKTAVHPIVRLANGKMGKAKHAVGVAPWSAPSVRTIQTMAAEARFLAGMHNSMAEAYPQLGIKPVVVPELDSRLIGKPSEVADAFTKGQRKAGPAEAVQQAPVAQEPVNPPSTAVDDFAAAAESFTATINKEAPTKKPAVVKAATTGPKEAPVDTAPDKLPWEEASAAKVMPTKEKPEADINQIVKGLKKLGKSLDAMEADTSDLDGDAYIALHDRMTRGAKLLDKKLAAMLDTIQQQTRTPYAQRLQDRLTAIREEAGENGVDVADVSDLTTLYEHASDYLVEIKERQKDMFDDKAASTPTPQVEAPNAESPEPTSKTDAQPDATQSSTPEASPSDALQPEQDGGSDRATDTDSAEASPAVAEDPAPLTIEQAYPNLVDFGEGTNTFKNIFKLSKKRPSLLQGTGSPFEAVRKALSSVAEFTALTKKVGLKRDLGDALGAFYSDDVLRIAEAVSAKVYEQLEAAMDGTNGQKALYPELEAGRPAADFIRAKSLVLVEKAPNGDYTYNQELMESAVLAAINWMFGASNTTNIKEAEDVANILGIPEGSVTEGMIAMFQGGNMTILDVVPAMAQQITQFWGVTGNKNFDQAATVGVPYAVASEILEAMVSLGYMTETAVENTVSAKTPVVFAVNPDRINDTYLEYPNLLADMLEAEVQEPVYLDGELPPTSDLQMNSKDVKLTPDQKKMVENESATPYKLNQGMFDLYQALGLDNILNLFGAGELSEETHNKNHLESARGRNMALSSAFNAYTNLVTHMSAVAEKAGKAVTELEVRFPFGISSVGRAQMLGAFNPQASKLVREMMMPNRVTVDMTDPKTKQMHNLAVAQMFGLKIHTKPFADTNNELAAKIQKIRPAIDLLAKFDETGKLDADGHAVIKAALKEVGGAVMALHAMLDLARLENTSDLTEFTTSVYVEADGVTNGPANAIMNMTSGSFNAAWVQNAGKGGLNFKGMSMNDYRGTDNVDLYQQSTINAANARQTMMKNLEKAGLAKYGDDMAKLLSMFSKDINVTENEDGTITMVMERGAAKNPLTITVYGSSPAGIAGKISKMLMDAIYAEMTDAQKRLIANPKLTPAEAMFGHVSADKADAIRKFNDFSKFMHQFTQQKVFFHQQEGKFKKVKATKTRHGVVKGEDVKFYDPVPAFNVRSLADFTEFTLHPDLFEVLQENVLNLHTSYMVDGINQTLGNGLIDTVDTVKKLTNFQSMALALDFEKAVQAKLNELYPPVNGKRKSGRFISDDDQRKIMQDLFKKYPLVQNAMQQFLVNKTSRSVQGAPNFSRSLTEKYSMEAAVFAPAAAGVKGIPALNIGMGDGLMMQIMSLMEDAVGGTLKIFDGVNLPLDKIEEGSYQANKAVYQSWQGNIMSDVMRSYHASSQAVMDALTEDLAKGNKGKFYQVFKQSQIHNVNTMVNVLGSLEADGDLYAMQIQARHNALQRVNLTVDQMASANQPYHQNGGIDLSGLDNEQVAEELNKLYKEELAKLTKREQSVAEIKGMLKDDSRPVTSYTAEGLLQEARKFPPDLFETVKTALRSASMKDYVIHMGTKEQMEKKYGHPIDANGITDVANKQIYIVSMEPEVIAHELVHAATYENVAAVVEGTSKDQLLIDSVNRLRELRAQFEEFVMSEALLDVTPEQMQSIRHLVNSMTQAEALYGEAAALNEFMAWSVTNADLIAVGKTMKATALQNFTRKAVILLRRIFFGSAPDKLPKDFFNHVRFNTALVASRRVQPLDARMREAVLNHSTTYGTDQRLSDVQLTYVEALAPLLASASGKVTNLQQGQQAATVTTKVAAVFPMTGQAASTFRTIVGVLGTEASINPAAMAKAQELYNHVSKSLNTESFMKNPLGNDSADRAQAEAKYQMLVGKTGMTFDVHGRSSLMPAFLALATVDDGFREILSKLELPKAARYEGNTLDERLRNLGNTIMNGMSDRLSGVNKSANVTDAIDALHDHVAATLAEKEQALNRTSQAVAGFMDKGNDLMLEGIEKLSDKGVALSNKMRAMGWNRSAEMTELVSNMVISEKAEQVSETAVSLMNKIKNAEGLRSFANDIVGRVGSNATIYDMIKKVRSHVAAVRQEFRENVPNRLEKEFDNKPTDEQWTAITKVMAKTDLASLNMSWSAVEKLLTDDKAMAQAIAKAEAKITAHAGKDAPTYMRKLKQLATYMNTGVAGSMLLRNANAVARLYGEPDTGVKITDSFVKDLDALGSLYAAQGINKNDLDTFNQMKGDKGLSFMFSYLKQQALDEKKRANDGEGSRLNHYKGYVPIMYQGGESLIVAGDEKFSDLVMKSYERLADYRGAGGERNPKRGYYFSKTPSNAPFQQGIIQNVVHTGGGVSADYGFTQGMTGGVIINPTEVQAMEAAILNGYETGSMEHAMPVFDKDGNLIAFERSLDPDMVAKLTKDERAHVLAGAWRGRQVEEAMASGVNHQLVYNLKDMYKNDTPARKATEYVNLFNMDDPVARDAFKLVPRYVLQTMEQVSGGKEFMVRRDVLQDVLGYRSATIGDAWSGNSRWSEGTLKSVRNFAIAVAGNDAYRYLVNAERTLTNYVGDARRVIAIKSVVVPFGNIMSNMLQLLMRGVPMKAVMDGMKYTNELDTYVKNRLRQVDAEAELRAAKNTLERQKLTAEIDSLKDAQTRLSIWPLLEAGEFTAISDVGLNHEDTKLTQGKWMEFIETQMQKLPEGVRTAGRYAVITQDTALFQGLQKMVQYGDFIAKATLYHDLVGRKGMKPEDAMAKITEEFVNYDRLPGRFRGTLENVGLLWFYNFKLRIMKVGASMLRDNPFHSLVAMALPIPDALGVGTVIGDNAAAKLIEGTLGYSMGPGMGLSAPSLNPWWNLSN